MNSNYYLGIDCGSISLKVAILDNDKNLLWHDYLRTFGDPINSLKLTLERLSSETNIEAFKNIIVTGSARDIISRMIGCGAINEITTHGLASMLFYPEIKNVIEIGGQDSKLILLEKNSKGETIIIDSVMNDICAAGTGSFLDQQAYRMGLTVEELSEKACRSSNSISIAGRCSVFAKTDMIHFQQEGISTEDLSAGLCDALARAYVSNLVKGKKIKSPILFQGGVAANRGMKRAFAKIFNLNEEDIIVPNHFKIMGAIGSSLYAIKKSSNSSRSIREILEELHGMPSIEISKNILPPLSSCDVKRLKPENEQNSNAQNDHIPEVYIGIDVGSVSAKIAVIDKHKRLIYKFYTLTHGTPLEAVKKCLRNLHNKYKSFIKVKGVGVTGSGRSYVADFVGADIIKNEITAQASATVELIPDVDTIIEIGGQDSKYIRIKDGTIVDFIMNKTCAAGTGSFLAEQADRLNIDLEEEYSNMAMNAKKPVDMGTRCTVFMETDCIHYQQINTSKEDIIAGLSYSIAKNYLEKVSGNRVIGDKIVFQGGVAYNTSVAAAFGQILNKKVIIPPHHEITGALGIAYITSNQLKGPSRFVGFDLEERVLEKKVKECTGCSNICKLVKIKYNDGYESVHGSICGKFEREKDLTAAEDRDFFKERRKILMSYNRHKTGRRGTIGIPQILLFHELFPLWSTFFNEIGYGVVISDEYSKQMYEKGLSNILIDTCYPIKTIYGAIINLCQKGVKKIFVPYILNMPDDGYKTRFSHNCQYVQQITDFIKSSMDTDLITHTVKMKKEVNNIKTAFIDLAKDLNVSKKEASLALKKAIQAQDEFVSRCKSLGKDALNDLRRVKKSFVIIGHPYIVHDKFFNLNLINRLHNMGILTIPADILPLENENNYAKKLDLIWKTNNRALNAVEFIYKYNKHKNNKSKLLPLVLTTFGCPADSMLTSYLNRLLGDNPWLEIELDEHNSITGILTRCEAFWESVKSEIIPKPAFKNIDKFSPDEITIKDIKREDRTLYILSYCESAIAFKDVLEKHNVKCKMISKTTPYSNELGRKFSNEKHCRTYQVILGDLLAASESKDFYPEKSAFLAFGYEEACRFSLFKSLHAKVIEEQGHNGIWMFGPIVDNPLDWKKRFGVKIAIELWEAFICYDSLIRYKYKIKPYEKTKGETDKRYKEAKCLLNIGIKRNQLSRYFIKAMEILKNIETIERDLVHIGIVGDAFTRVHDYGMAEIFRNIENMEGVVILPPSWHDFIVYGADRLATSLWEKREYGKSFFAYTINNVMKLTKSRLQKISTEYSRMLHDQNNKWLTKNAAKYVNPKVAPVIPSMFVGKCVDFVEDKKVDGLINAYGFNCALGKISTVCLNKLKRDNDNIPILTFVDDGLQQTNIKTRLEAFMEQAWAYRRKTLN